MQFTSPQVPTGNDLVLANTWFVVNPQMEVSKQHLQDVQRLHERYSELLTPTSVGTTLHESKENQPSRKCRSRRGSGTGHGEGRSANGG